MIGAVGVLQCFGQVREFGLGLLFGELIRRRIHASAPHGAYALFGDRFPMAQRPEPPDAVIESAAVAQRKTAHLQRWAEN